MILVQLVVVLTIAPLLTGVINRTKAVAAGRTGPPVLQAYYDIVKLLRKRAVLSPTTTWVFFLGPAVSFAAAVLASLMLPLYDSPAPIAFTGDIVFFVYLFALGRFFTTAAALDTGSAFEGMGAARELAFACLAEPALFLGLLALARVSRSLSLSGALLVTGSTWRAAGSALVLVGVSWFIVLLAENCRVPFDDPNTHLELTMIHEVMVLDHGGPAFGLVLYAGAVKLLVFSALVVRVLVPRTGQPSIDGALCVAGVLAVAVAIGVIESVMARLRLVRVPQLIVTASLAAGFAVVLVLR